MKTRFLAVHPKIGTKNKPAPVVLQERSPYYWWWAYLRRNSDYLACCEAGGKGDLATLYSDFGDVRSDDFRSWWGGSEQRGAKLFGEKHIELRLRQLSDPSECTEALGSQTAVIAVNLSINRRKLQKDFAEWLAQVHTAKLGRRALGKENSTAQYPLHRNFSQHNLRTMLEVYDAWTANLARPKSERKTMWQVGEELKLIPSAMTSPNDLPSQRTDKLNVMTAAVSRYVRHAKAIIANTAKGQFPNNKL